MKRLLLLCVLLATYAPAQSQIPSYEPGRLATFFKTLKSQEDECRHAKTKCDSFERDESVTKELQLSLGVQGCDQIATTYIRLDGVHEAGFVRMQCGWNLNLVFAESSAKGWRFLQTIVVPNKYWEATIDVASVTEDKSQQVLIHKAQYVSGTGIGQQNFVVYKIVDGRVLPVLDVVESSHIGHDWYGSDVSQASRFTYQSPGNGADAPAVFHETQILEFSGTSVELKRDHTWWKDKDAFVTSQWLSARTLKKATAPATKR